jgi:hypothetical protein
MGFDAGSVLRITVRFKSSIFGDMVNVWHVRNDLAETADDDTVMDAIDGYMDTIYSLLASTIRNTLEPYDIRYDLVEWSGGKETLVRTLGTRSWTLTSPPSGSGEMLTPMDAAIVNLRTALPKVFGRKYISGIGETGAGDGVVTSAVVTALTSFATAMLSGFVNGSVSYLPGVLSGKSSAANKFALFVGAVVNSVLGTQRRRRQNRGS